MTLEQQVCSLPLAKRLAELGVKQESLYNWIDADGVNIYRAEFDFVLSEYRQPIVRLASAFTVAELGEMLPPGLWYEKTEVDNRFRIGHIKQLGSGVSPSHVEYGNIEADARAKMLVYLIESGLMPESLPAQKGEK